MTDRGSDDHASSFLEQWMAEQKAEERALAQRKYGVLWGTWSPDRFACRSCGEDLVDPETRESFLDSEEDFSPETVNARAALAYDLMWRDFVNIPDWINPASEFWRATERPWSELPPDEIIMMATAEDSLGQYGQYRRVCDEYSHVFIRACPHCNAPDPLNLRSAFAERGMQRMEPPHEFLEDLRQEQVSRQNRAR